MRFVLRGKIHRATVTERHPDYVGSIVVDPLLLKKTDIWPARRSWSQMPITGLGSKPTSLKARKALASYL